MRNASAVLRHLRKPCLRVVAVVGGLAVCCLRPVSVEATGTEWVPDQLIVRPHPGRATNARGVIATEGGATEREVPALGLVVVRTPPGRLEAVERNLRASKQFRFIERNYVAAVDMLPDDPLYPQQWGLPMVQVPTAWDTTRGGGVTIAIVDTGVDVSHPDLAGRTLAGFNAIYDTTDVADDNGHGTRMAGIAGAAGFNGLGVIGMAPEAMLLPVKSMSAAGYGTYADIADGIAYAADHGARVINLSLGGSVASSTLANAIAYAVDRGAVIVAAAGNYGSSTPSYPAAYPDAIAVGAIDDQQVRASFSNYGTWLDIVAPGVGISTTDRGGLYASSYGTSPASPFVAGAAALVLSVNPSLQPHQVASILAMTNADIGAPGFDEFYGWGLLDADRAVSQAMALAATPDSGAPVVSFVAPQDGAQLSGTVDLAVDATDDVGVVRVEYSLDGLVVASSTQPPFNAQWDIQLVTSGPHLLGATAYDASGNRGTAQPLSVDVSGPEVSCGTAGGACFSGGGGAGTDCFAEWFVVGDGLNGWSGRKAPVLTCTDGSPCDRDGTADGVCTFHLALCFSVDDSRLMKSSGAPACTLQDLTRFTLLVPKVGAREDPLDALNATALVTSVSALGSAQSQGTCVAGVPSRSCQENVDCDSVPGVNDGLCDLAETSLAGVVGTTERCTSLQPIRVPLKQSRSGVRTGRRTLKIATLADLNGRRRAPKDTDSIGLVCAAP